MATTYEQPPYLKHIKFEDFVLGDQFVYGAYEMRRDEMVTFAEKFEQSFNMICNPTCDDNTLNKIMNAHLLVQNGKMTQHDASVAVGQTLVDKYVKPTLDNAGMEY